MGIFRTSVRVVNRLIISLLLVLTPLFGFVQQLAALDDNGYLQAINYRPVWTEQNQSYDDWGFGSRNCTSYVAYKQRNNGVNLHNKLFENSWGVEPTGQNRWGNAYQWDEYAVSLGYVVDSVPAAKSIAHWNAGEVTQGFSAPTASQGGVGHVAYVESVNPDGSVIISDYNAAGTGEFRNNITVRAARYIHVERTLPGGWWQGSTPGPSSMQPGATFSLSARIESHTPGGLQRGDITIYNHYASGGSWRVLKSTSFSGQSVGDINATYTVPNDGTQYIRVSFNVYAFAYAPNSSPTTHQYAPSGIRQYCMTSCPTVPASQMFVSWDSQGGGGSGGGGSTSPLSNDCSPGQYQAAVFTEPNFQGNCVVRGVGEYSSPEAIGLPDNSVSSIKVGSGANVRLCENPGMTSPCFYYSSNDDRLGYYDSLGDNTLSSMKVEDTAPTTGCVPNDSQVAFFMNENYQELCIIKGVGRYDTPGAIGLPDNSISSVKVGNRVALRLCDNVNNDSPCDQFERDVPDLTPTTVQNNKASSAEITLRGGIKLCDGTNYTGECKWFGAGMTGENLQNMSSHNFDNRVESVYYEPDWDHLYHIVLYTEQNQTGYLYHADSSVADIQNPYRNNISSIKIYRNHPPNARTLAPANGTIYPSSTTSATLNYTEGQEKRVHVWSSNGYDFTSNWSSSETTTLTGLAPGTYSWQAQSRSPYVGEGMWSAVQTFSINTPPTVAGGTLTMDAGATQSIQVQAFDAEGSALTMSASGLPAFATFTDMGGGTGTLQLNPSTSQSGQYNITVTVNDGSMTGTGTVSVTVNGVAPPPPPPPPSGFQASYFNNLTLSGTPVLTRSEAAIDNDWGGGGPGNGVNNDNFSARWTRTTDFAAGSYTFSVTADDGVRLYIDGVLSIDKWIDQGATTYTATKTLSAGPHTIKMEYYEKGGGAVAKFSYQAYTAPSSAPGITSGGIYKITNAGSGKALDVTGASTANGAKIQIWTDTGVVAQKWQFNQNSDGTYTILNPNSNKVMDVDGGSTANGAAIQIWDNGFDAEQKWVVSQHSDGTYKLRPSHTNRVMDVNGGSSVDGTKVQIWDDNGSAAQKWRIVAVSSTPPATPTFTGNGTISASTVVAGNTITLNGSFTNTSSTNSTARIHFEVRSSSDQQVFAKDFDNETFAPGQTKTYTATWAIPANAATGSYVAKGGAVSADWGTWYLWLNNMGQFTVNAPAAPPPQTGTELLTAPWNIVGNNGASEKYQSIASNALAGKTTLRVTYNLHGLNALGGDASAIIFDQNGWKFVSLSNYGQNGLNGTQTVDIPLSAFGLDLNQPVGTLHTRFWHNSAFTVDITSIQVF